MPHGSSIQAVIFDKHIFSTAKARAWLRANRIARLKPVHTTKNYHRYRIQEPDLFTHFVNKKVAPGIKLIIGFHRK